MKTLYQLILIFAIAAVSNAALPPFEFSLRAPLADYLHDAERFAEVADAYSSYLDEVSEAETMQPDDSLFVAAGQVHLALLNDDLEGALSAAQAIREMQADPAKRALTGLVTRALVDARRSHPANHWTHYAMTVQRQFASLLAVARPAPTMERLEQMEHDFRRLDGGELGDTFLAEYGASRKLDRIGADQLIRVRHKTIDIVPVARALAAATREQIAAMQPMGLLEIPSVSKQILVPATHEFPKNSEGSMIELKNGDLLYMWTQFVDVAKMVAGEQPPASKLRRSPHSDDGYARIAAITSSDGGYTWSKPWVAIDDRDAEVNIMSPGLTRLADGRLLVAYSWRSSRNTNNEVGRASKMIRFSDDEGRTWSDRLKLPQHDDQYHTGCFDRSFTLSNGRVLVQRHTLFPTPDGSKQMGSYLNYSDDNGRTWSMTPIQTDAVNRHFEEACLVERPDESLLMVFRASRGQSFFTESFDHGTTWSKPYPSGVVSARAPTRIARIPDTDDILMIWNSTYIPDAPHGLTRHPLMAAVSSDGGKSWGLPKALEVDPRFQWAYAGVLFKDDRALVHYYRGPAMAGGREIVLAHVPIDWFTSQHGTVNFRKSALTEKEVE